MGYYRQKSSGKAPLLNFRMAYFAPDRFSATEPRIPALLTAVRPRPKTITDVRMPR